jgi:hypothetical protein
MEQGRLYPIIKDIIEIVNNRNLSKRSFTFAMNYFILLNTFNGETFPYSIDNRLFKSFT